MKKILFIVLDGLGDLPVQELNNKTPLEAAVAPNLDYLAQRGVTGLVYPVAESIAPESDIAVISLLGYDAHRYYTGRGPLESFAEGLDICDGDVSLRVNFATAQDDGRTIHDRRVGRDLTEEETIILAKEINSKVTLTNATFEFKNTIGHRGVLVIRGMHNKLSGWINNTDPAYLRQGAFSIALDNFANAVIESTPMAGYEDSLPAQEAARSLNEFTVKSNKVLNASAINKKRISDGKLAANILLSRDAGDCLPKFPALNTIFNLRFGSFVEMPVERGIARLTGMEIVELPSSCGHLDVDYMVWAKVALEAMNKFDVLYVHIKGPDEPAHDGEYFRKKEIIEEIDKFFVSNLLKSLDMKNTVVAVTADHSTVCNIKAHSADPVPLVVSGGNIKPDGSLSFSEKAAFEGSLGKIMGREILPLLITLANK